MAFCTADYGNVYVTIETVQDVEILEYLARVTVTVTRLGGSAKKRQRTAIAAAQTAWAAYKRAKAGKGGEKWH